MSVPLAPMSYTVGCECGRQSPVTAAMAGGEFDCACGRSVHVPRLSELRQGAGQGAFETGSVDVVRRMVKEGQLPAGEFCQQCSAPTGDVLHCTVVCERPWMRSRHAGDRSWLLTLLLLPLGIFYWKWSDPNVAEEAEIRGREVAITVPLRVCQRCREGKPTSAELRSMLQSQDACRQLMEDYPEAEIVPGARGELPAV